MMRNHAILRLWLLLGLASHTGYCLPAFPGAEGWGAVASGGRGGKVLVVSNTNPRGPGSFMEALMTKGPRIIVFRTSGVIRLDGDYDGFELNGPFSDLTIAGQTSPGGITFTGTMNISGSIFWCYDQCKQDNFRNGIFRFLRFRGNETNMDAISLTYAHTFIFDHCDFSGGSDETQDLTHDSTFTVQWCTIANSSVCADCQTYGSLISYDPTSRVTLHHNLWAHHENRAPVLHWIDTQKPPHNGLIDYRNNLIYDVNIPVWIHPEGPTLLSPLFMNSVSNYYKTGPQGLAGSDFLKITAEATLFAADNVQEASDGSTKNSARKSDRLAPFEMPMVRTETAGQAYESVLRKSGAWPRDAMNARTVNEVRTREGRYGKTDDALIQSGPTAPADTDLDGMPDFWETAMKLNPNSPVDATGDADGDGYSNVEEYLNDLASARLCEEYQNPVYPIPSDWLDYDPDCALTAVGPARSRDGRQMRISRALSDGSGRIRITLADAGAHPAGTVRILDWKGRVLARMQAQPTLEWNGAAASGRRLPAGAYLIWWDAEKGPPLQSVFVFTN